MFARRRKPRPSARFVSQTDLTTEYEVTGRGIPGTYRAIVAKRTGHIELLTGARRQPVAEDQRDKIMVSVKIALTNVIK